MRVVLIFVPGFGFEHAIPVYSLVALLLLLHASEARAGLLRRWYILLVHWACFVCLRFC